MLITLAREEAKTVLRDTRDGKLLYVFDIPGEQGKRGKFVILLDADEKRRTLQGKRSFVTNQVRSGGVVKRTDLADKAFEVVIGGL